MDLRNIPPVSDHTIEALRELSPVDLISAHRDAQYLATEANGTINPEARIIALNMQDTITDEINRRAVEGEPLFDLGDTLRNI